MNSLSTNVGLSPDVIRVMTLKALIGEVESGQTEEMVLLSLKRDYGLPADATNADLIESLKDAAYGLSECEQDGYSLRTQANRTAPSADSQSQGADVDPALIETAESFLSFCTPEYRAAISAALAQQVPADGEWRGLLEVAVCPNEDCVDGRYYGQNGEPVQCQWCYGRKQALSATPQAPQPVLDDGTDAEVLRDFIRLCREQKPVGQWPGERVCLAIERAMANERPFRFIAEADMAPERGHNGRGGDSDRIFSGPTRQPQQAADDAFKCGHAQKQTQSAPQHSPPMAGEAE